MKPRPSIPWPRLSETLIFPREPGRCQACGLTPRIAVDAAIVRWQEHDENDRPEPILVNLCGPCSVSLIDPHPRLYRVLDEHEPFPGSMFICIGCDRRAGLLCTHPASRDEWWAGLMLAYPLPTRGFIDYRDGRGRRRGEPMTIYHGPVTACAGLGRGAP